MILRILISIILLSSVASAQVALPQPNYAQYGSYSRQMTVYENTQEQFHALELRKYRKFREEVARNTITQYTIIERRSPRYHDTGFVLIRRR